jgi:hypothetical protein
MFWNKPQPPLWSKSEANPDPYVIYNFPYTSYFSALKMVNTHWHPCTLLHGVRFQKAMLILTAVQNLKSNIKIVDALMLCCIYSARKIYSVTIKETDTFTICIVAYRKDENLFPGILS